MAQSAIASAVRRNRHVEVSDDIKAVFAKYDRDKSGDISSRELRTVLLDLKVATTRAQAKRMIAEVAGPEVSKLSLEQFAVIVAVARTSVAPIITERPVEEICKHSVFGANKPLPYQGKMRAFYTNSWTMGIVAAVIVANFGLNIVEKEIDADVRNLRYADFWNGCDVFFNIAFLIELLLNMYGYGGPVRAFWRSAWNVFDFIIVVVGIALMSGDLPPPLQNLKLLRAFRVFRLFARVKCAPHAHAHARTLLARLLPSSRSSPCFLVIFVSRLCRRSACRAQVAQQDHHRAPRRDSRYVQRLCDPVRLLLRLRYTGSRALP